MIALDTETTGVDIYHGALPFFVTTCQPDGSQTYWEWDVDPLTRRPLVPPGDLDEVHALVCHAPGLVLQNSKFDVAALRALDARFAAWPWDRTHDTLIASHVLASNQPHDLTSLALQYLGWHIEPCEDALEQAVQKARRVVQQARLRVSRYREGKGKKVKRRTGRGRGKGKGQGEVAVGAGPVVEVELPPLDPGDELLARWAVAEKNRPDMPSAGGNLWKNDTWLPRALVKHWWETSEAGGRWLGAASKSPGAPRSGIFERLLARDALVGECSVLPGWEYAPPDVSDAPHPWWTVLAGYANTDSAVTVALWPVMERELRRRDLWDNYLARLKVMGIAHRMEHRGVTVSEEMLDRLVWEYREEAGRCARVCVNCAEIDHGYDLVLPKGGVNTSLREFVFGCFKLPPIRGPQAKTSAPTLNAAAMEYYLATLPQQSPARQFLRNLVEKRRRDTAVNYLLGYKRFWLPLRGREVEAVPGWYVLHPSLNPTGTDTLRWSSSHPNEQNISKKEGFNLRQCFGPAPGREWWSLDAKNIELRIPAYESGEPGLIELFERPDDPPYYGSTHLLNFSTVYPELWAKELAEVGIEKVGPHCKKKYASTYYQWVKNGGFAVQYGAVDRGDGAGTADRAFHRKGGHALLKARFSRLEALNQKCIRMAEELGYVETLPSKAINPRKGYPILCTRTEWGRVKPTVPLNFMVQSTAMEWMQTAMVRCDAQLAEWNAREGVADGDVSPDPFLPPSRSYYMILQVHDELVFDFPREAHPRQDPARSNLARVRVVQKLMEQGGDDIGVPTPVSCSYHATSWADGVDCDRC